MSSASDELTRNIPPEEPAMRVVRDQLYLGHGWYLGAVKGLTDEQANYLPPGTVHPAGAVLQHLLFVEDDIINRQLGGGETLWEQGGWDGRIGPKLTGATEADYRAYRAQVALLDEYRRSVWSASDVLLAHLGDADLRRVVATGAREQTVAALLGVLLNHTAIHVGEIAATKGFQGLRGSPL